MFEKKFVINARRSRKGLINGFGREERRKESVSTATTYAFEFVSCVAEVYKLCHSSHSVPDLLREFAFFTFTSSSLADLLSREIHQYNIINN